MTTSSLSATQVTRAADPPGDGRAVAWWTVTALAFPIAGLPALALGGVDNVGTALLGGAAAGAVIGAAQALVLPRVLGRVAGWAPATAAALAVGLALGSALVDYRTGLADLVVQGVVSGTAIGAAQALLLRGHLGRLAPLWAAAAAVLWPLGWAVTTAAGVSVQDRFAVFGATGALVHSLLGAVVLVALRRRAGAPPRRTAALRVS